MYGPLFRESNDMELWTCTMCIDIDHVSKEMSEGTSDPNKNTLNENEICMASRILLELLCDTDNSIQFMNFPPKYLVSFYYQYSIYFSRLLNVSDQLLNTFIKIIIIFICHF